MIRQIIFILFVIFISSCSIDEPSTGTYDILEYRQKTSTASETLNFEDIDCIMHNGNEVCASGTLSFSPNGTYTSDIQVRAVNESLFYFEFVSTGTYEEFNSGKVLCNDERICTQVNLKKDKITLVYPTNFNGDEGSIELDLGLN